MLLKILDLDKVSSLINILFKLSIVDKMTVCVRGASNDMVDLDGIVSLTDDPWYLSDFTKTT